MFTFQWRLLFVVIMKHLEDYRGRPAVHSTHTIHNTRCTTAAASYRFMKLVSLLQFLSDQQQHTNAKTWLLWETMKHRLPEQDSLNINMKFLNSVLSSRVAKTELRLCFCAISSNSKLVKMCRIVGNSQLRDCRVKFQPNIIQALMHNHI